MRRLAWLALLACAAWWLLRRRCPAEETGVTIGYDDGSAVILDDGAPERDRLLQAAAEALGT